jgi:hypothetical protein
MPEPETQLCLVYKLRHKQEKIINMKKLKQLLNVLVLAAFLGYALPATAQTGNDSGATAGSTNAMGSSSSTSGSTSSTTDYGPHNHSGNWGWGGLIGLLGLLGLGRKDSGVSRKDNRPTA